MYRSTQSKSPLIRSARKQAFRLIGLQGLMVILIATVFGIATGHIHSSISVLMGGGAYLLPNLYFAFRFFAHIHTKEPRKILNAFYWEEFCKMVLSIALLLIILCLVPNIAMLALFIGFLSAHLGLWLASNTNQMKLSSQ